MLVAMCLLGGVYAGFGWVLHRLGVPVAVVAGLAAVVLVAQWRGTERLAMVATRAEELGPERAPDLHQMLERLCALRDLPKPRLALSRDGAPNAFTVGRTRRRATIVVTSGLRWHLEPREVEAVLAHELAHIQHHDVAVMTMASSFAVALAAVARAAGDLGRLSLDWGWEPTGIAVIVFAYSLVVGPIFAVAGAVAHIPLLALSRYRELAADRTAAVQLGQPALLAAALVRAHHGQGQIPTTDLRARACPGSGWWRGRAGSAGGAPPTPAWAGGWPSRTSSCGGVRGGARAFLPVDPGGARGGDVGVDGGADGGEEVVGAMASYGP
jgi:heat shock protein HtpX